MALIALLRHWPACHGLPARLLMTQLAVAATAGAATIWTGPPISFSKAGSADPTQDANQDRLTTNVWITRGSTEGIYNARTETTFSHFFSPADTEWANGTTTNYSSLAYTDWDTWARLQNGGPPQTVGTKAVVHLKSDDIYLDIKFTSWSTGATGGGFSYVRSTPFVGNIPPAVNILNPRLEGATFKFSFQTQTGYNYSAEFALALNHTNWSAFTNFVGDGSVAQVADPGSTNSTRYFRVVAH